MDDLRWRRLTARFRYKPANFQIEQLQQKAEPGSPLRGGSRAVIALAFSADSTSIAASGGGLYPGAADIRVFDVASRELRRICHYHRMGVFNLAFDPGTGLLASASHDYSVVLWDLERDDAIFLVGGPDAGISRNAARFVGSQVIVADGMTFAGERAALTAFDLATGDINTLFELDGDLGVSQLVVLPQRDMLIAAIGNQRFEECPEIRCLTSEGTEKARYPLPMILYDLAAVGTEMLVGTGAFKGSVNTEVFVTDAVSGRITAQRALEPNVTACVATSPAGGQVALAYGRSVEICNLETLKPELEFQFGDEQACSLAWSPDGAWIAVGTQSTIRLFHAATGTEHLA